MTTPFSNLVEEVERLHDIDATHKRGFKLSERTWVDALLHTIEELTEVGRAKNKEEATSELGDVLVCLIHYAIKSDINIQDAATAILEKLPLDFPGSDALCYCKTCRAYSGGAPWCLGYCLNCRPVGGGDLGLEGRFQRG